MNVCPSCIENHTYFYNDTTKLIEFNKCVPGFSKVLSNGYDLIENCLASNDNGCIICQENSSLGSDGFCYTYKDNNCEGIYVKLLHNNLVGEIDSTVENGQAIVWALSRTGCDRCRSTFINVSYHNDYDFCILTKEREDIMMFSSTSSSSEENSITNPSKTIKRILETTENCLKYDVIDTSVCVECSPDYLLNPISRTCEQIQNCSNQTMIFGKLS